MNYLSRQLSARSANYANTERVSCCICVLIASFGVRRPVGAFVAATCRSKLSKTAYYQSLRRRAAACESDDRSSHSKLGHYPSTLPFAPISVANRYHSPVLVSDNLERDGAK